MKTTKTKKKRKPSDLSSSPVATKPQFDSCHPTARHAQPVLSPAIALPSRCSQVVFGLAVLLLLIAVPHSFAAEKSKLKPYAVIIGTVFDAHSRIAPGVKVKIQRQGDKKPKWELVSDRNGEFAQRFPAGKADYLVWAEPKGKKGHIAETKVHIESDERQDIGLHLPE
jgi:hypothetical protein